MDALSRDGSLGRFLRVIGPSGQAYNVTWRIVGHDNGKVRLRSLDTGRLDKLDWRKLQQDVREGYLVIE